MDLNEKHEPQELNSPDEQTLKQSKTNKLLPTKVDMIYENNHIYFSYSKKSLSLLKRSILPLINAILSVVNINNNEKIWISYESGDLSEIIINSCNIFNSKGYQTFIFDNFEQSNVSLDEYLYLEKGFNWHLRFTKYNKDKKIKIDFFNIMKQARMSQPQANSEQIVQKYLSQDGFDIEVDESILNFIPYHQTIKYVSSNKWILKAFAKIHHRYKGRVFIGTENKTSLELCASIMRQSNTDVEFVKKSINLKRFKINSWFYKPKLLAHKNKTMALIHFDKYHDINLAIRQHNSYLWLSKDELALVYFDFIFEEMKRAKLNMADLFVVVPVNASKQLFELLTQYNISYRYYQNEYVLEYIDDKKCIFIYDGKQFNADPRFSRRFNNYYFLACIIWMLNSYQNRNNLLPFKNRRLKEIFGSYKHYTIEEKVNFDDIKKLENFIKNYSTNGLIKKLEINKAIFHNIKQNDKLFLFTLTLVNNHQLNFMFDEQKNKLVIENCICVEYDYKSYSFIIEKFKIKKLIKTILKLGLSNDYEPQHVYLDSKNKEIN